nr:hypothetical protein [Mycoplasmopsis bovis]
MKSKIYIIMFSCFMLKLGNVGKTYSMWYDAVLNNKSISDDEKIRPEFWEKDLNKNQ